MWGTFILETYTDEQRAAIAEALEDIASPRDDYGFASGGVYCFWDPVTRQPLYIGRAVDLPDRFRQHNGLGSRRTRGTKLAQINRFFAENPLLGYSILVRSPLSQTSTARRRRDLGPLAHWIERPDDIGGDAEAEIARAEGVAIRSHWLATGRIPPWNAIQGEATVWSQTMRRPDMSGPAFCGMLDSLIQARRTITELAKDPTAMAYDSDLHTARIVAVARTTLENRQLSDHDILAFLDDPPAHYRFGRLDHIRNDRYLLARPSVMSAVATPGDGPARLAWTQGRPLPDPPPPVALRAADELPFLQSMPSTDRRGESLTPGSSGANPRLTGRRSPPR